VAEQPWLPNGPIPTRVSWSAPAQKHTTPRAAAPQRIAKNRRKGAKQ